MSLFKLKNLWSESFSQQQFDERHLSLGKIDEKPAIALGSFSGIVRVFLIDLVTSQFKVQLIYENTFQSSIVSVQYVTHPQQRTRNTIGILLYRKFFYLSLRKNTQTKLYQPKLLQIATQPAFAIEKTTLSLMTLNSSIQYLNPLSTQVIKVSDPIYAFAREGDSIYFGDGQQLVMIQNSAQQWRITVGAMRGIHIWQDYVIIIGDNALWQVKDSHIDKTKVLEQDISYGTIIPKQNNYNIMIANFANQIFIYTNNYQLIWAIKANQVPIKIEIFNSGFLAGALAILGEEGSQLPETKIEPINQDIDMQQVQLQTKKMQAELQTRQQSQQSSSTHHQQHQKAQSKTDLKLTLTAKLAPQYSNPQLEDQEELYYRRNGEIVCCVVQCLIRAERQAVYEVGLSIKLPSNLSCRDDYVKIDGVKGGGGVERIEFFVVCSSLYFPYSNSVEVVIRYQTNDKRKGCNVISETCQLPFNFQSNLKSLQLEKQPINKIVLKASTDLPSFADIFHQFSTEIKSSKNLTITLSNGIVCSMGYNKNNTKVKIESNQFLALCYMLVFFNCRFERLKKQKKIGKNQITIDDIPLEEFFNIMKDHYGLRTITKQKSKQLEKKCQQFRNTEKKLIIKMKQKVSTINNMDKLLQYTYKRLIHSADEYEQSVQELQTVSHNLEVGLQFVLELLFLKTKANLKCKEKVYGIIGYEPECSQFGWEEKVISNSAFFLNKKFNYMIDVYSYDQVYKTVMWVIAKVNQGKWNQ